MAKKNRTTVKSDIVTLNVPTVTNAIMTTMLNTELADNLVFGADVAVLQSSSASNITVDFTGKDRVDLTRTGGSLNITVSGIDDGETKFLLITKTVGQVVTWVGVSDITPLKGGVTSLSFVLYEIVRKASSYFAKAWVETVKPATVDLAGVVEIATDAENNALSSISKACTPGYLPLMSTTQKGLVEAATVTETQTGTSATLAVTPAGLAAVVDDIQNDNEAWHDLDYSANFNSGAGAYCQYFKDNVGNVHVRAKNLKTKVDYPSGTDMILVGTLPAGYRTVSPYEVVFFGQRKTSGSYNTLRNEIAGVVISGEVVLSATYAIITSNYIDFDVIFRSEA